ncbi:hypothetical protein CSPB12327_08495 [Campylobacter sp. RM12327]|uniref:hypothetical protein n=1 Tax=Campylobacter sputorum TaxID=206 RepID=UPI000B78273A|nr:MULTISPECIES: hypothetical protein [Campylobacter]MBF6670174.1 hypothetical protein [Campylobacter sp. RM12327]MBF6676966.1 hypothetical protein [Campylobacter sp. RM12321]MBF6678606.1 hypothetical protein [Campylobacter sp. RM11259]
MKNFISVGSPKSATYLKDSTSKVGAEFIMQLNHPNDPVANGFLNKDGDYDMTTIKIWKDIKNYHPFEIYYPNIIKYINNTQRDKN